MTKTLNDFEESTDFLSLGRYPVQKSRGIGHLGTTSATAQRRPIRGGSLGGCAADCAEPTVHPLSYLDNLHQRIPQTQLEQLMNIR